MTTSTIFTNNGTQTVRLPAELRFPENIKQVEVRAIGNERIISPVDQSWDSFFLSSSLPSEDFMTEQATPIQDEREAL